jgi:hypothetical protein
VGHATLVGGNRSVLIFQTSDAGILDLCQPHEGIKAFSQRCQHADNRVQLPVMGFNRALNPFVRHRRPGGIVIRLPAIAPIGKPGGFFSKGPGGAMRWTSQYTEANLCSEAKPAN